MVEACEAMHYVDITDHCEGAGYIGSVGAEHLLLHLDQFHRCVEQPARDVEHRDRRQPASGTVRDDEASARAC